MAKSNKFGAFSGVFTPSILTILGVIMYMRLGWVVGEAGLIAALAIILLAHVISITTGLSISSIATDKKIKAGGIYYILSRSLGLPMGGAIGIALTVGTALSISMYLVGFAENFLSIQQISDFFNLEPGVNSYRIVGTVVLIILVILGLISTSLAIKTQYFILAAIVLSLVSIFVGFGINLEFRPDAPILSPANDGVSLEKVFAIFFPAVTGFTAGVAMSGDLRDPKKNIPIGTLLAIATGFVVYISLTIGFGLFVNRQDLINDNNIAMHVSWIPSLVIAGVWGATLSSALGGILGGPRILQALAKDRVMPVFFAKGYGKTNEPRNALLLIFLIAEGGILIGNLNAIAGIVTMFYLTSYGFINLAYVLESWASTDFRPSFKISRWFGVIGFLFAFAIMFKLDMVSMLAAFVIIGGIYFILQRKQLQLDYGDVWQSVWISIVRKGLNVLDVKDIEDRNWQPNIILFSGGTDKRPHLVEFGKSLVGRFGLLTNFDLTVDPDADVLFPKHKQSVADKINPEPGIFMRRQSCKNIYDGIEMIVRTYGFSGIEPNTVILGWGRQSQNPERFVKLIQIINELDYNLILLDYDPRYGYGNYKRIDIWWRGAGNNGNFALSLAKFMTTSEKWENAEIRLMIVNDDDSKAYYLYRRAKQMLDNLRIEANVKIINNEVEQKPFYDIIRRESKDADLIFIGIPNVEQGKEKDFVAKTNKLLFEIGTVALIKASSQFKELNLGVNLQQKSVISASNVKALKDVNFLIEGKQKQLYAVVKKNLDGILQIYEKTIQTYIFKENDDFSKFIDNFDAALKNVHETVKQNINQVDENQRVSYLAKYQNYLLKKTNNEIDIFKKTYFDELTELLDTVINDYIALQKDFFAKIDNDIYLFFDKNDLKIKPDDSVGLKVFKSKLKLNIENDKVKVIFKAKERKNYVIPKLYEVLFLDIEKVRIETLRFIYNFEEIVKKVTRKFTDTDFILNTDIEEDIKKLRTIVNETVVKISENRNKRLIETLNEFIKSGDSIEKFYEIKNAPKSNKLIKNHLENISREAEIFFESFELYLNYIQAINFIDLFSFTAIGYLNEIEQNLKLLPEKCKTTDWNSQTQIDEIIAIIRQINKLLVEKEKDLNELVNTLPQTIEIMDENSLNDSFYKDFEHIFKLNIPILKFFDEFAKNTVIAQVRSQLVELTFIAEKLTHSDEQLRNKFSKKVKETLQIIKELETKISSLKIYNFVNQKNVQKKQI